MFSFLRKFFGLKQNADYAKLVSQGAQLIDVRTPAEYEMDHLPRSLNIPLSKLPLQLADIQKDKPVILYCGSGMRSAQARRILMSNGFKEVYNGGGLRELRKMINTSSPSR